jgi:hypothetical protein
LDFPLKNCEFKLTVAGLPRTILCSTTVNDLMSKLACGIAHSGRVVEQGRAEQPTIDGDTVTEIGKMTGLG